MTLTVVAKEVRSVRSEEAMINVTYCLIHPKAIFKKLLIHSRVS